MVAVVEKGKKSADVNYLFCAVVGVGAVGESEATKFLLVRPAEREREKEIESIPLIISRNRPPRYLSRRRREKEEKEKEEGNKYFGEKFPSPPPLATKKGELSSFRVLKVLVSVSPAFPVPPFTYSSPLLIFQINFERRKRLRPSVRSSVCRRRRLF